MESKSGKDQRGDQRKVEEESGQVFQGGFSLDNILQEHESLCGERKEVIGEGGKRPFWVVAVEQLDENENVGDEDAIEGDVQERFPLLTTFLSFGFLWRNPGFLPSGGGEDDSEPELERRRRRRLQQAKDSQRGIVGSQFSILTSSMIRFIRFEDNWGQEGAAASQLIALPY